jgi:hypothetical protein
MNVKLRRGTSGVDARDALPRGGSVARFLSQVGPTGRAHHDGNDGVIVLPAEWRSPPFGGHIRDEAARLALKPLRLVRNAHQVLVPSRRNCKPRLSVAQCPRAVVLVQLRGVLAEHVGRKVEGLAEACASQARVDGSRRVAQPTRPPMRQAKLCAKPVNTTVQVTALNRDSLLALLEHVEQRDHLGVQRGPQVKPVNPEVQIRAFSAQDSLLNLKPFKVSGGNRAAKQCSAHTHPSAPAKETPSPN